MKKIINNSILCILFTFTLSAAQLTIQSPKDFNQNEILIQNNTNNKPLTKNHVVNNSSELNMIEYDNGFPDKALYQQIIGDQIALKLTPSRYPYHLKFVYINIADYGSGSPTDSIEIRIYDDGGINNSPGPILLENLRVAGPNFTAQNANSWIEADVSNYNIIINEGDFYISTTWLQPLSPTIGVETEDPNELRTWVYEEGNWSLLADKYPDFAHCQAMFRALGITIEDKQLNNIYYDNGFPDKALYQQIIGDQIALRFSPLYYPCYIKGLFVNITNYGSNAETDSFEVRIYESSQDGNPGNLLLSGIKTASQGSSTNNTNANDWIFIDVSEHNISINDGDFFMSIVWVNSSSPNIGSDLRTSNHRTWIYENEEWTLLGDSYPDYTDWQIMLRTICSDEPTTSINFIDNHVNNFHLAQNYPNPFNPSTTISYTLPRSAEVIVDVFNSLGQKVKTLMDKQMPSGLHRVKFNAENLPSGVYFFRLQAGKFQAVKKMLLIR